MHSTYAVTSQPMGTMRSVNYGTAQTSHSMFQTKETPQNITIASDTIRSDFGRIKGVEVLHFRNVQLERNVGGESAFASMGPLQVLYFPQYDRFVLSLNSWKYPLLKRIPIVGSSAAHGIPVTYTLPTVNGFFSLIITRVENMDSLANLETIFMEATSFKPSDSDEILSHSNILGQPHLHTGQYIQNSTLPLHGNMMQHSYSPRYGDQLSHGHLGQSFHNTFQSGAVNQSTLSASGKKKGESKWRRFFRKPEYGSDKGERVGTSRHNLNLIQKRDINSMKMTSEVMAAVSYYPRKEVERWIIYNKEMASIMGFSPELADEDFTPFGHSILNRSTDNTDPSLPCNQPITCERTLESTTYQVGQNFTSATRHDGKMKHGYIQGHSHSIHPEVAGRYNNLSTSNFQPDRFKQMTDSSALYEASGISPINKIENPYTFNQEDNILSEETRPSVTERIKEAVTGHHHDAGYTATENTVRPEETHVSFADKVKNMIHPTSHTTENMTSNISHTSAPLTSTIGHTSTPLTSTIGQTVTPVTSGQATRIVESSIPTHTVTSETLQPSTQYLSGRTVTSTLPTLQERIRTVGTSLQQPTVGQRIQNATTGTEHANDLVHHHYAA